MKAIYKRYIIWSKSIVDIKVSNTEKSKNNLEKCMKVGPPTLSRKKHYFLIFYLLKKLKSFYHVFEGFLFHSISEMQLT